MADDNENDDSGTVGWGGILATLSASFLQSAVFYLLFLYQRAQHKKRNEFSLYEPRQYIKKHGTPFSDNWIRDAWNVSQEELLSIVGLDTLMYLRFLLLGTRVAAIGVFFSMVLVPLYATGNNRGAWTTEFNLFTLARVEQGSNKLWATVAFWWLFISYILLQLWREWKTFQGLKFRGTIQWDPDSTREARYAVRVELSDRSSSSSSLSIMKSDKALAEKFEELFPSQIRQANIFLEVGPLEKAIAERQIAIEAVEKATAFTMAKPLEPRPQTKIKSYLPCKGETVDTIEHFSHEVDRLNRDIDDMRAKILHQRDLADNSNSSSMDSEDAADRNSYIPSSTGIVVFKSLLAKESAMKRDDTQMTIVPASDPEAILWENVTVPLRKQKYRAIAAAVLWTFGVLWWAVPVALMTAIANLGAILKIFGLSRIINQDTAIYGIASGLAPVVALIVLMIAVYEGILTVAKKYIRFKSAPEVGAYAMRWHMLFQFANLWLILIGGSLFHQVGALIKDPWSIVDIIAYALPGASRFFVNMISVNGVGRFGLELSMLPQYGTTLFTNFLLPEAQRTQRMIDEGKKPPEVQWGKMIPQHVFVFFVMIMYQPIAPLVDVFALVYFCGTYIVWKHQCMHVYCQPAEGEGSTTWQSFFGFLLACLYMSEMVFIAYMGIKEAPSQAACGFVPLTATLLFHYKVHQAFVFASTGIDAADGTDPRASLIDMPIQEKVYWQPSLKAGLFEREPMPYRRVVSEYGTLP
ncbi:unnamed protein product [Cylindrotheca closterium]|uniref:DUF221-domain-containing protein n=1 Tax=Cylindrotheca closterium TaxID=2856 RepID=A0AAD2JMJ1_9STRA|nr:unnamed protein product [Cylindrotheca closterium]